MKRMTCYTCAYGRTVYDRKGLIIGVECTRDSMRLIFDSEIKERGGCLRWTEADE